MSEIQYIIGIDPGFTGGICVIESETRKLHLIGPIPVIKNKKKKTELDEMKIREVLIPFIKPKTRIFIEQVNAMPQQGVVSMFRFGTTWGLLRGICVGLGNQPILVHPIKWKNGLNLGKKAKKAEYKMAKRFYPSITWIATKRSRKPHEGMIDAALIAAYGRQTILEQDKSNVQ